MQRGRALPRRSSSTSTPSAQRPTYAPSIANSTTSRTVSSTRFQPSSDLRRVQEMGRQLDRINSRIEQKLQLYRHEAESSQFLLSRARRLTDRLDVLKHKLRMCFELCGVQQAPNLQLVLQQMRQTTDAMDPENAPPDFICPITQCVMIDPVRTADGHVYDRAAIMEWFAGFEAKDQVPTSPLTNLLLPDTTLTVHVELRQQIRDFLATTAAMNEGGDGGVMRGHEEPSLRLAAPIPSAPAPTRSRDAPIWSSSVVPPNEANSRELNLLRISNVDISPPTGITGTRMASSTHRVSAVQPSRTTRTWRDEQNDLRNRLAARGMVPPVSAGAQDLHTGATSNEDEQLQMHDAPPSLRPPATGSGLSRLIANSRREREGTTLPSTTSSGPPPQADLTGQSLGASPGRNLNIRRGSSSTTSMR